MFKGLSERLLQATAQKVFNSLSPEQKSFFEQLTSDIKAKLGTNSLAITPASVSAAFIKLLKEKMPQEGLMGSVSVPETIRSQFEIPFSTMNIQYGRSKANGYWWVDLSFDLFASNEGVSVKLKEFPAEQCLSVLGVQVQPVTTHSPFLKR